MDDEVLDLNQSVGEDCASPALQEPCCAELQRRLESEMKRCDALARGCQVCTNSPKYSFSRCTNQHLVQKLLVYCG